VIENQIAKIDICEVLVSTQANSSLFSQSQEPSINLLILASTIFVKAKVAIITTIAKAKFINISTLKKLRIKLAFSPVFSTSFHQTTA